MTRLFVLVMLLTMSSAATPAEPQLLAPQERLEGRFVQERQVKGFDAPLRSEGSFVLAPGTGLLWKGEKPFATTTVITGGGIVQLVDGVEASRIATARAPFLARFYGMLGGTLTGDLRALERDFAVKRDIVGEAWRLTLTPRRSEGGTARPIESIVVTGSRFAEQVEIARAGGDRERLVFTDHRVRSGQLDAADAGLFAVGAK